MSATAPSPSSRLAQMQNLIDLWNADATEEQREREQEIQAERERDALERFVEAL